MARKKKMFPEVKGAQTKVYVPSFISHLSDPEVVGTIQGKTPGSREEWRVAVALNEMGIDYEYQFIIGANRPSGAKGIFKLDFLLKVHPLPVGLEIQSKRWHSAQFSPDERFRIAYIESKLKSKILYLWEFQLKDQEQATQSVQELLGVYK